ncbi:unnamed protein product [Toxocara canis]|uniref:Uncharacterized protein n=1 Tax=Toxocara canis TaxID=6265 RepID=A0A183UU07_TOXCA|nr:unnamed protein product [Toxocara canis]
MNEFAYAQRCQVVFGARPLDSRERYGTDATARTTVISGCSRFGGGVLSDFGKLVVVSSLTYEFLISSTVVCAEH